MNRSSIASAAIRSLAVVIAAGVWVAGAGAAEVPLDNGVVGDGHINITVDDFGSFADAFAGGAQWLDLFDPSPDPVEGELLEDFATFSSNIFFFIDPSPDGNGTHKGAASSHLGIASTYNDGNITCEVTQDNSVDQLPTSTSSVFTCTGPVVEFEVSLTQTVSALDPGPANEARAMLEQSYSITNTAGTAVELIIVKHIDEDMPWGGGGSFFLDDLVGADFAELDRPQVFAQDRELTTAALVLRTLENHDPNCDSCPSVVPNSVDFIYYCGKQGLTPSENPDYPGGNCPMYDYGTDFQIWDNFGAPNCWKNNVPGVGHNVPGTSPQLSGDSHIGLQVEAAIAPGVTYSTTFQTIYGFRPPPTLQIPPPLNVQTIQFNPDTGCGEFFWSITNNNPIVVGEDFVNIATFFLDIEAGDGGDDPCLLMTPPDGWTAELCSTDSANGHFLYKFTGGTPLIQGATVHGRLTINTNGLDATTDPVTLAEVPPLSVVIHAAQEQIDPDTDLPFECDFNFGPERNGNWSGRAIATAHLPVPSMSAWARILLTALILGAGTMLVLRSRKPVGVQ